jgi:hypothetical protein
MIFRHIFDRNRGWGLTFGLCIFDLHCATIQPLAKQRVIGVWLRVIEIIYVRRCTEPNEKVKQIYTHLNYRNYPFTKRKSVVHNSEIKKNKKPTIKETNDS